MRGGDREGHMPWGLVSIGGGTYLAEQGEQLGMAPRGQNHLPLEEEGEPEPSEGQGAQAQDEEPVHDAVLRERAAEAPAVPQEQGAGRLGGLGAEGGGVSASGGARGGGSWQGDLEGQARQRRGQSLDEQRLHGDGAGVFDQVA